jgi:SAM-dependent methyltransferase
VQSDPLALLSLPGGAGHLQRAEGSFIGDDGRRFPVEKGIVRMLGDVDQGLAAELAAQEQSLHMYVDDGFLLTRYERNLARIAIEELMGKVSGPILDAGCGVGLVGRFYPDLDLYGLDASFSLLEQVGAGYRMLIEGSAEELPFRDGSFDAVLSLNMLHHVMSPERAMSEMVRVLRPGGIFVSLDPRKLAAIELAKRVIRGDDPAYATTHKAFEVREYVQIVKGGGALRLEQLRRFGFLALLAAGGLDQVKLSHKIPSAGLVLDTLTRADEVLARVPGFGRIGLYLGTRARRVSDGAARVEQQRAAGA